jgi:hypothetical protein
VRFPQSDSDVYFWMTSRSGLRGHTRTYLTILESADHALFKMVRCVLLRTLRPELDVVQNNCRVRFVGISRYVHFRITCTLMRTRRRWSEVLFVFFRVLSHKTDKIKANEPKAKISCCSKNDLKMIWSDLSNGPFLRSKIRSDRGCKKWSQRSPILKILILWSDLRSLI